jgi:hypothetical protein
LTRFFELFDIFINNSNTTNSKKIVLAFFDELVFQQQNLKEKLGTSFPSILSDTIDLLKDNVFTNYKSDFDDILEQLQEKAKDIPELNHVLERLQEQCK